LPSSEEQGAQTSVDRIRDAALRCFGARGVAATSLREIAEAANVSIGLVQHHFGTKAGLIDAVDAYVMEVLRTRLAGRPIAPGMESINDFGQLVVSLISEHIDILDYLSRAYIDGSPVGLRTFDALVAMGDARWEQRAQQGLVTEGLDRRWATLNPLLLVLGALLMRTHLDRHLPEPFLAPEQLARWEKSVNTLLREGQLRGEESQH